jgi:uncharacterized protein (DUF58 family)
MGISGFFGKANISRITVSLEFPLEIYSDTPFPVKLTLHNHHRLLPAFLIKVKFLGMEVLFPFVDKHSRGEKHAVVSLKGRGTHEIDGVRVSSVFPFNFFTRFKQRANRYDVIVFPQLKRYELTGFDAGKRRSKGESPSDKTGYESDMISIRKYVLGDPVKYINWKATAKTGDLKIKELSSLVFQPILVDFDKLAVRDLEERISYTAYILLQLMRQNVPVGLKLKEQLFPPAISRNHRIEMLKALALYRPARKDVLFNQVRLPQPDKENAP